MDPLTMALVAGATMVAGKIGEKVVDGAGTAAGKAVVDAYDGLKDMLARKFGAQSNVVKAAADVESEPDSAGYKLVLEEQVKKAKADQDAELLKAAQALLASAKSIAGGTSITQTAIGNKNVQNAGDNNKINVD